MCSRFLATGAPRNGFGRLRSISTPEGARAHGVSIPPQGGSPVRRPGGLPNAPSSEHDSERELMLLRGCVALQGPESWSPLTLG